MEQGEPTVDTSFNFITDTPAGRDPDRWSPTLHRYHKFLWGRALPSGRLFELHDARPRGYLRHTLPDGSNVRLSSDSVIQTFTRWKRDSVRRVISQVSENSRQEFYDLSYTMGGMMLFPTNSGDRLPTINQARGWRSQIADRFDLTLECVGRHYRGQDSPLGDVFHRYAGFFELFETFDGYVKHFLLQDLLSGDGTVGFFLSFDDFQRSPLPQDPDEYTGYLKASVGFVRARNRRIHMLAAR